MISYGKEYYEIEAQVEFAYTWSKTGLVNDKLRYVPFDLLMVT